jgi:hypothetical protein
MNPPMTNIRVADGNLRPEQQPTPISLRRSTNYVVQRLLKHPECCRFHSLAELYFAALLEAQVDVTYFCPQPYEMWIKGNRYIPDIYFVKKGMAHVVEIRASGKFSEEKRQLLETYFRYHQMSFEVVANESILEREIEAQNWLFIVRNLLGGEDIDTETDEYRLIERLQLEGELELDDIVDPGDRQTTQYMELATYRLLYRQIVKTNLETDFLSYGSVLRLCV